MSIYITESDIKAIVKYYSSEEFDGMDNDKPKLKARIIGFFKYGISHVSDTEGSSINSLIGVGNEILTYDTLERVIQYLNDRKEDGSITFAEQILLDLNVIGDQENLKKIWLYAKSKAPTKGHTTLTKSKEPPAPKVVRVALPKGKTPQEIREIVSKATDKRTPKSTKSTKGGSHKTKIQFTRKYKRRTSRKNKSYKVRRT
jgi:hypothetical protein